MFRQKKMFIERRVTERHLLRGKGTRQNTIVLSNLLNARSLTNETLSCIVGFYPLFYAHCSIMYIYCAIILFLVQS